MSYYAFANLLKFTQLNMKNNDYFLSQEIRYPRLGNRDTATRHKTLAECLGFGRRGAVEIL